MTVVDTIFKALAPAVPDRVIAGHFADLGNATMFGFVPDEGRMIITSTGPIGGGWGAKMTEDGVSATVCINDGDTHNSPVELMESKYPIVYEKFGLVDDSGGAGRHRGGLGSQSVIHFRKALNLSTRIERMHCRPWGLEGAGDGLGNQVELNMKGVELPEMQNAKVMTAQLNAGDSFRVSAGGGGGFGPPWMRPAEKVREDVRQGYVSLDSARSDYGVVLDPETLEIDPDESAKLRDQMAATA